MRNFVRYIFVGMLIGLNPVLQRLPGNEQVQESVAQGWLSPLSNDDAWQKLPAIESGRKTDLPIWARMLAAPMPRTTAALLELDLAHRTAGPVPMTLRHAMRWVTAHANHCDYAEAMALGDGMLSGFTKQQVAGLKDGSFSGWTDSDREALQFSLAMAVDSAGFPDAKFQKLVELFGERVVAAMVLHSAFANFQDRLLICLGCPGESGGTRSPVDVRFNREALVTAMTPPASATLSATSAPAPSSPVANQSHTSLNDTITWLSYDALQGQLELQRKRTTRLPIPDWSEISKKLPPGLMDQPSKIVWYQIVMGYADELAVPFEIYLRTAGSEISRNWDRILGNSIFWMVTDSINCPYCMGHCEMNWEVAGLSPAQIAERSRILAGSDWSSLPQNEQRALLFARKLTATPWKVTPDDLSVLRSDFGDERALYIAVNASRYNYMTRISNGFQLTLESENVFWDYYNLKPPTQQVSQTSEVRQNVPGMLTASKSQQPESSSSDQPRPTPLTRPEMKELLEDMKGRTPRIPLPPAEPSENAPEELSRAYESRVRSLYVPTGDGMSYLAFSGSANRGGAVGGPNNSGGTQGGGTSGFGGGQRSGSSGAGRAPMAPDPAMSLDYAFKTRLFWIASRANNCQYCLGHQESKLLAAGMTEDEVARLDCEWEAFPESEQSAFALARRLTLEPHLLSDADIDACRPYYSDLQIIEMIASVAGNNAINRWKEGIGVPQSAGGGNFGAPRNAEPGSQRVTDTGHSYLTATSEAYQSILSKVTFADSSLSANSNLVITRMSRPPLESRRFVLESLASAENRKPRLSLATEETTRLAFEELLVEGPIQQWHRLMGHFPSAGKRVVGLVQGGEAMSALSPRLRSQIRWSTARQDRAWYAMSLARKQLRSLGETDDAIFGIDDLSTESLSDADRSLIVLANHLAASPVILTDAEVQKAVELAGPEAVAQCVHFTCICALFNRLTEAAGLTAEAL